MKKWKILSSKNVFNKPWYKLRADTVQLESGRIIKDYYLSVRDNYVIVFPLTPEGEAILVKQYKHGAGRILWELPGGLVNRNESPRKAAKRELLEETGYKAKKLQLLGVFYDNPTKNTNKMYAYLASGATKEADQTVDKNEQIEVQKLSLTELKELIARKQSTSATSVLCALLAIFKSDKNL